MNKIGTIIKIALFTIVLLVGTTYLVAPKQTTKQIKNEETIQNMNLASLPKEVEIVGKEGLINIQQIIKPKTLTIIAIANQDALPIISQYKKYCKNDLQYVTVANIANAPWFLKKLGILPLLEKINQDSPTPMIYDSNGWFTKVLNIKDQNPVKYFVYKINQDGNIEFLFDHNVKSGLILEETIEQSLIEQEVKKLNDKLQSFL